MGFRRLILWGIRMFPSARYFARSMPDFVRVRLIQSPGCRRVGVRGRKECRRRARIKKGWGKKDHWKPEVRVWVLVTPRMEIPCPCVQGLSVYWPEKAAARHGRFIM